MARFRNKLTGSVVNVDDATAETLGSEYEPAEADKAPAKKAASSKTSK
jgi:hypothetical protein